MTRTWESRPLNHRPSSFCSCPLPLYHLARLQLSKRFVGDSRTGRRFSHAGLQPGVHQVVFVVGVIEIVQPGNVAQLV